MTDWKTNARVIADSINQRGNRLITFEVEFHRFILAEVNTHRALSRNSASSRAIPYRKMRDKVMNSLAYPVVWPAEQKGMQGGASLDPDTVEACKADWYEAAVNAVQLADTLHERGLHKSLVNRLLEPFIPHKAILSGTEWDNFFAQRLHPDAQPEIHQLAIEMKAAMDASTPEKLSVSEWHTPYISESDVQDILNSHWEMHFDNPSEAILAVSAARCARVSYETHDGVRDPEKDYDLYSKLKNHVPPHASPFEHVARPVAEGAPYFESNFVGFEQYRHILDLG